MVLPYIKMNLPQVYMCSPSWTLLPPPSPYHPSGLSQCTSPKHPVSCIKPGLVTHFIYGIIHISMPFSQIIPPSPSPTESKRLFYTSVSLLLPRIYRVIVTIFLNNIIYETSHQSRFDARYSMLGAGALGRPRGMVWGGRWEEGSGWGTCVYLWWIHVDIWQNQYNIVKLKKKNKRKI